MASRSAQRLAQVRAARADRHALYQRAVQDPEPEVRFLERVFRRMRGRRAVTLREDFCGTAVFCAAWVRSAPDRRAVGVDLDAATLDWGRRHNLDPLGARGERVTLLTGDVLSVRAPLADVITAFNFSYSLIHERSDLLAYFRNARDGLGDDGILVLDVHAGPRTQQALVERTRLDGFVYVWEQGEMDAISGRGRRAIHFEFQDGSALRNAFRYDFRIWTLPELRDLLAEAGFSAADVYFENFDERGYSLGGPRRVRRMTHEDSWIAYLVAAA